jgi:hypothetical protein
MKSSAPFAYTPPPPSVAKAQSVKAIAQVRTITDNSENKNNFEYLFIIVHPPYLVGLRIVIRALINKN